MSSVMNLELADYQRSLQTLEEKLTVTQAELEQAKEENKKQLEKMDTLKKEKGKLLHTHTHPLYIPITTSLPLSLSLPSSSLPLSLPSLSSLTDTDLQTQQSITVDDRLSKTKALWMKTKKELDTARKTEGQLHTTVSSLNGQLEREKQLAEQNKVSVCPP